MLNGNPPTNGPEPSETITTLDQGESLPAWSAPTRLDVTGNLAVNESGSMVLHLGPPGQLLAVVYDSRANHWQIVTPGNLMSDFAPGTVPVARDFAFRLVIRGMARDRQHLKIEVKNSTDKVG